MIIVKFENVGVKKVNLRDALVKFYESLRCGLLYENFNNDMDVKKVFLEKDSKKGESIICSR